jgi:hypothetical protein
MSNVWAFLVAHQTTATLIGYYVFAAFVGALPMPDNTSGKFYRFFFAFINTIAANISRSSASISTQGQQPPKVADPPAVPPAPKQP